MTAPGPTRPTSPTSTLDLEFRRARHRAEMRRIRRQRLAVTCTVTALVLAAAVAIPVSLASRGDDAPAADTQVRYSGSPSAPSAGSSTGTPASRAATPSSQEAPKKTSKDSAKAESASEEGNDEAQREALRAEAEQLPVLAEGDYGSVIEVAQRALNMEPTGYYGPVTAAAVAEFQQNMGLPATGMIATYTWSALGGGAVADASAAAGEGGYVDGEPPAPEQPATEEQPAEESSGQGQSQGSQGQESTQQGTASRSTNPGKPPVLEETDSGGAVAVLQRALSVKPASGYFGPVTAKAVRAFQESVGLPTTGVVARYTWGALGDKVSRAAAEAHAQYGTDFGPGAPEPSGGDGGNGNGGGGNGGGGNGGGVTNSVDGRFCPVANFSYGDGMGAPRGGRTHMGLDMMGAMGEPIYAVDPGTVTREEYQSNGALVLDITGPNGMFFYGHFDSITVGYGDKVQAGQLIGYMGDTGSPGAVHLHIEYRPSGWSGGAEDIEPLIRRLCGG